MPEITKCRKCECPIEFIEGPSGKLIPVQKVRTAYVVGRDGKLERWRVCDPGEPNVSANQFYVSHFETCSDPARFSRGGRGQ